MFQTIRGKLQNFIAQLKHKCKSIQEAILQYNDTFINVLKPNDLKGRPIVAVPNSPAEAISSLRKNSQTHCTMFNNLCKR